MDRSIVSTEALTELPGLQSDSASQRAEGADFRVQRAADRLWEILALSERAGRWLRANYQSGSLSGDDVVRIDLIGANEFMRTARAQGYRIAYVGPHSVNLF
ncbi:hypothetical protein ABIE78_005221 [Sinorhizobium fredii]|nr:hypothetical protein CO676_31985 [Sinorhizobium sp. BJ1]